MKTTVATKTFYLLLAVMLITGYGKTTAQSNLDSLKRVYSNYQKPDSGFVNTCLDISWEYMYTMSDSAEIYAREAIRASKKISNPFLETNSYNTLGVTYIVRSNYSKALSVLDSALFIAKKLLKKEPDNKNYIRRILATYTNIGNVYYFQGEYSKAIDNYLKALNYSEKINFNAGQANSLSNISMSYKDLHNYDKALEYNYKSLALAKKTNDSYWLSASLNNLGTIYFIIPDYDSTKHYFLASMKMFEKENNEFALIESNVNMGNLYKTLNKFDTALTYYKKALELSTKLASPDGLINTHYMMGQLYDTLGNYPKAIEHFNTSNKLAEKTGTTRFEMLSNTELARVYAKIGNYKQAYLHFQKSAALHDSIFNQEHDKTIAELETKYQIREKEERIKLLTEQNALEKAELKNNQLILISVITILTLLLIAIFMAYRSYKHKQIAEKILMQQKSEKKVLDAVIRTEFEERKRFAEELHDAMGAHLSTLKLYINEMAEHNISDSERQDMLKHSNSLLDEAISNARSISHNIMPASLKTDGLESSLRSFIDKINASGKISIHLTTSGLHQKYKPVMALSVYRMITEMINNTLKHANASSIKISLSERNNKLYVTYNDNGKGFNFKETLIKKEGLGLKNILNRIEVLGGNYKINSKEGKGFFASLEFET